MALRYYEWPYDEEEEMINNFFLIIFIFECLIKIFAFGHHYFKEPWNIFDFAIIILSVMTWYIEKKYPSLTIGSSATVFRSLKLGRLVKLVKKNKSLIIIF